MAKTDCYPEHIEVSETGACFNLISLLAHTTKRILMDFDEDELEKLQGQKLLLIGRGDG